MIKRQLSNPDSPQYKILQHGCDYVTDAELISVLTGRNVEQAREISTKYKMNHLAKMSYHELLNIGLPSVSALRLVASFALIRRRQPDNDNVVHSSKDAFMFVRPYLADKIHEEMYAIFLNRSNRVICIWKVSQGGISGTVTDIRLILKKAIEVAASSLVLAHNHPSGNLKPSQADMAITKKIDEAGKMLDVKILDHVIIGDNAYFSFADEGLI